MVCRIDDDDLQVLLVHRPRYNDWTFPKGKLKPGEGEEQAALREVQEETGLRCHVERELAVVSYRDSKGRPKTVRYWVMRPLGGGFKPTGEVDEIRWLSVETALNALSYEQDRMLLRKLEAGAPHNSPLGNALPEVLFVCVHNAGRSQMAAALLERLAGDRVRVRSAGTEPVDHIHPAVIDVMREVGIDLVERRPRLLEDTAVLQADVVITMGCGDACPVYPGKRYEDWELSDPASKSLDEVRLIRDEIERRVRQLLASLG
jgi:arsenate reductase (thioredoxin)